MIKKFWEARMRLYHFTGSDYALLNLRQRHLKVAFADEVNDLFELCPFDFIKSDHRKAWRESVRKHSKTQGFISFTKCWSVPTMWAHYASNHKGLCFGFDVSSPELHKISYAVKLRRFDERALTVQAVNTSTVEYASKTKSAHWKYEEEWRTYVSLSEDERARKHDAQQKHDTQESGLFPPLFFLPFGPELKLKEVIIGVRSEITPAQIEESLEGYEASPEGCKVEVVTARPSFRDFKIVRQQRADLQR
jgi:hypothetical protein